MQAPLAFALVVQPRDHFLTRVTPLVEGEQTAFVVVQSLRRVAFRVREFEGVVAAAQGFGLPVLRLSRLRGQIQRLRERRRGVALPDQRILQRSSAHRDHLVGAQGLPQGQGRKGAQRCRDRGVLGQQSRDAKTGGITVDGDA